MGKKYYIIGILNLLIIILVVATIYSLQQSEELPPPPTSAVTRENIQETVLASGTVDPFKTVEVGAQVSGQLQKLYVELGDEIEPGQLLAEIDPVLPQNALKGAEAERENVTAQINAKQVLLNQYQLAYKRQQQMIAQQATSDANLENAEAQLLSTRAELSALKSQLRKADIAVDTAQANLGYTRISAPMKGVVISIDAQEGQTLVSSQNVSTILTIANLNQMTVKAEISEADITRVAAGQTVYFTILGEPEIRHYAVLRTIEPSPVAQSTSSSSTNAVYYNGLFEVDNLDRRLRVGMTAEVTIVLAEAKQALVAPVAVMREASAGKAVVDIMENGRPFARSVRTGLNDKVKVQIVDGVSEGDQLVLQQLTVTTSSSNASSHPMGPPPGGR